MTGDDSPLPPVHIGGAGLTLFPGPLRTGVLGSPIPLPGSLRLTNALDVGGGPSFVLDLDPNLFVGHILGELDLSSSPRAGTPEGRLTDPSAQQRTRLRNTLLRLDTKNRTHSRFGNHAGGFGVSRNLEGSDGSGRPN